VTELDPVSMECSDVEPGATDHLVDLAGGWRVWRCACLRAAGFTANFVLHLVATDAAAAAETIFESEENLARARQAALEALTRSLGTATGDAAAAIRETTKAVRKGRVPPESGSENDAIGVLRRAALHLADVRSRFPAVFDASRMKVLDAARVMARDPRLREAITWQNPSAIRTGLDSFASSEGKTSRICRNEDLVASYLQRYATKNDSIGFFGPIGWARFETTGDAMVVKPGPDLIASRSVRFEHWPIDAIALRLGSDPRFEPWMIPRRFPFVCVSGTTVSSPVNGRTELTPAQVLVLAASDGTATATDVASRLVSSHPDLFGQVGAVLEALRFLRGAKLLAWAFEIPVVLDSERVLRGLLARVDDEALRAEALRPLEELDAARQRIADAAGDAARLGVEVAALETLFTRITGLPPTRAAGTMYAARQLVFEDCRRDVDVAMGPALLSSIGPALNLILASARWVTVELGNAYRARLRALYEDLSRRAGSPSVPFVDLWLRAQRLLYGVKDNPVAAVLATLQERWARVLALPEGARDVRLNSSDLEPSVAAAFLAPRPGWTGARYHCPDVMIAASSAEAIRRGDYEVVMGELHLATNTIDAGSFFSQHATPQDLLTAFARDIPEPFIRPVNPKDWPKVTARTTQPFVSPSTFLLESGFDPALTRHNVLATGDLLVEDIDGQLLVRTPAGVRIDLMDVFGDLISKLVAGGFRLIPKADHNPRVTIDRLVVSRESWTLPSSSFDFADAPDDASRFLGARRWARARGMPRFVYVKTAIEEKPVYVDLDAPAFVNMLAKLARRAKADPGGAPITVAEMLPTLEQTWLQDAAGEGYTSELRVVCVDGAR
jgi:Lantibiotic dehydratase, N terminus